MVEVNLELSYAVLLLEFSLCGALLGVDFQLERQLAVWTLDSFLQ